MIPIEPLSRTYSAGAMIREPGLPADGLQRWFAALNSCPTFVHQ